MGAGNLAPNEIRSPDRPSLIPARTRDLLNTGDGCTPLSRDVGWFSSVWGRGGGAKAGKVSGRISMPIGILTTIRAMSSGNLLCQQILLPTCTWWSICSVVNSSSKPGRLKGELPAP